MKMNIKKMITIVSIQQNFSIQIFNKTYSIEIVLMHCPNRHHKTVYFKLCMMNT